MSEVQTIEQAAESILAEDPDPVVRLLTCTNKSVKSCFAAKSTDAVDHHFDGPM